MRRRRWFSVLFCGTRTTFRKSFLHETDGNGAYLASFSDGVLCGNLCRELLFFQFQRDADRGRGFRWISGGATPHIDRLVDEGSDFDQSDVE